MQKTENLQLNIIDGTDVPSHAVFNENFNKLDEFARTNNTNMENVKLRLDGVDDNIEQLKNENSIQNENIEELQNTETDLSNRIEILENVQNKTYITVSGIKKSGTYHRVKLTANPITKQNVVRVPVYNNDTDTLYIRNYTANVSINMNEVLGINSLDNIIMLGVGTYQSSYIYQGSTNVMPMQLKAMGKGPGNNDLFMYLTGTNTDIITEPVEDSSTVFAYPQYGDVEIIIEYMVLD